MIKMMALTHKYFSRVLKLLISAAWLSACATDEVGGDPKKVRREMREKAIVKASEPQIMARAEELGQAAVAYSIATFKLLSTSLSESSCVPVFAQVSDSVYSRSYFTVKRYLNANLKSAQSKSIKENEILEAYAFNVEQGLPLLPNLQKDGNEALIYSAPLTITDQTCLKCHSKQDKSVSIGDTIGIWTVTMPRKEVIISFAK
jgi:hypothetical protein